MLRTNLSTKPFYNERAVHMALAIAAGFVIVFTIFNLTQILLLTRGQSDLHDRAGAAEAQARQLRAHAAQVRQGLNTAQLAAVSAAAQEANAIISQRLFSWTDLLNRLETTLPDDVRITSVRPQVETNRDITVQMTIVARRVEDVEKFMENLEATGAFSNVGVRSETTQDDELLVAIEGQYAPPRSIARGRGPVNMRLSFRRVFDDKRRIVIPVLAGLALNILLYVGVVYPLIARERGAEERERTAAAELAAATRDDAAARGLVEGRSRTDEALKSFYQDVLPNSPASARLVTYLKLAQLARQYNLEFDHKRFEPQKDAQGSLAQLRSMMSLRGDYEDIRQFLYRVESNSDFVVIDSVLLAQGTESGSPLTLTLSLSTYYRKNGT